MGAVLADKRAEELMKARDDLWREIATVKQVRLNPERPPWTSNSASFSMSLGVKLNRPVWFAGFFFATEAKVCLHTTWYWNTTPVGQSGSQVFLSATCKEKRARL
jgi:hypothetical protein